METDTGLLQVIINALLHPIVVVSILLITGITAFVVWPHAEEWQRVWMVVVIAVYVVWLLVALSRG